MPKYAVDHLIRRLARRAKELSLYIPMTEQETLVTVGVYLTSLVCDMREWDDREGE